MLHQKRETNKLLTMKKAKAEAAAYQLELEKEKGKKDSSNDGKKTTPKWVLPVAIGGGLLVVGLIVFFVIKKK